MRLPFLAGVLGAAALAVVPSANAADAPIGIGFAQAEEGTFFCRDADPAKAFSCALAKCRQAAGQQQCVATRWCTPAGWSGTMIGWLPEFHVTQIVCGTGGAEAVTAALKALCENTPEYSRCDVTSIIDPEGAVTQVQDVGWPGPLTKPPATSAPAE